MPPNVLKLVASGVACCAAAGFIVGLNGAGHRPRLPGETDEASNAPPIVAADARPISPDEIAPPEPAQQEPVKKEEEKPPPKVAEVPPVLVEPKTLDIPPVQPDRVGDILAAPPQPPPEEPPH
jgi:hypothetical protein